MPTYEYACSACDNQWEEVQKISADPIQVCPKCGKNTAKRQISGGNFILKGGGWYADLYASSPKGKGGGDGKSEAKSGGGETSTAAPAAKTDSGGSSGSCSGTSSGSSSSGSGSSSSGSGAPPAK